MPHSLLSLASSIVDITITHVLLRSDNGGSTMFHMQGSDAPTTGTCQTIGVQGQGFGRSFVGVLSIGGTASLRIEMRRSDPIQQLTRKGQEAIENAKC